MVSSIELNAKMKPTSAQIAANVSVDWLIGAAAWREERRVEVRRLDVQTTRGESHQAGAHLAARRPGLACTKMRVIRPRMPVSCCA